MFCRHLECHLGEPKLCTTNKPIFNTNKYVLSTKNDGYHLNANMPKQRAVPTKSLLNKRQKPYANSMTLVKECGRSECSQY